MSNSLPIVEDLDFHYLLGLMPPLHNEPEFACLPELFSIIGYDKLILLCKYAGGETIKVPTLSELSDSIEALQLFYSIDIKHIDVDLTNKSTDCINKLHKIQEVYDVRNCQSLNRPFTIPDETV